MGAKESASSSTTKQGDVGKEDMLRNVCMQSDLFMTLIHNEKIRVVDLNKQSVITVNGVGVEEAVMNDFRELSVRTKRKIQVFCIEGRKKVGEWSVSEDVEGFWWVGGGMVVVTNNLIYCWRFGGDKVMGGDDGSNGEDSTVTSVMHTFKRDNRLVGSKPVCCKCDKSERWVAVSFIGKENDAKILLYSMDRKITQLIEGHAFVFVEYITVSDVTLLCVAKKTQLGGKLMIVPIPNKSEVVHFERKLIDVAFDLKNDYPVSLECSESHGCLYLLTRHGFMYIYHIGSETLVYKAKTRQQFILTSQSGCGYMGLDVCGNLLQIEIDDSKLAKYLSTRHPKLADELVKYTDRDKDIHPGSDSESISSPVIRIDTLDWTEVPEDVEDEESFTPVRLQDLFVPRTT